MIDPEKLLAYACGEDDDAVEAHVLACSACAATLEGFLALGEAIRELVSTGRVRLALSPELAADLTRLGLLSKVYTIEPGASVACSVGPTDAYQSVQLRADLDAVERVDVVFHFPNGPKRIVDVPFVAAHGMVWLLERADFLRTLPSHSDWVDLVEPRDDGDRLVARYQMHHSATA